MIFKMERLYFLQMLTALLTVLHMPLLTLEVVKYMGKPENQKYGSEQRAGQLPVSCSKKNF